MVSRTAPLACSTCNSTRLEQDPDVLDTWFSSGLWPFSTMGWPEDTEDLHRFYPTSLLITGFDILFFWVARMMMMGIVFMGDVPFRQVYIHGLVRDAERQKMSKTKGNVIDPLVVTEKYGTDAVRMTLLQGAAPGTDIVLTDERMQSSRAFANKVWNAARFLFLNMERSGVEPWIPEGGLRVKPEPPQGRLEAALEDRWIFSRLNQCADLVNRAIDQYRYHEAAQLLWQFIWHEFCDWYLELKKLRFVENSGLTPEWRNALGVFEAALRLLHPVMPFLTEEIWQRIAAKAESRPKSVALAAYPQYRLERADLEAERDMEILQGIITSARNLRAELKLDPKEQLNGTLYSMGRAAEVARDHAEAIRKLAGVALKVCAGHAPILGGAVRATTEFDLALEVPPAQLEAQRKRLEKEIAQLVKNIDNLKRQLGDDGFLGRAPANVVEGMRAKLAEYEAQLMKSQGSLDALEPDTANNA
jgi:valyl-tRNA synthetase